MSIKKTEKRAGKRIAENTLDKHVNELKCLYDIANITGDAHLTLRERFQEIVRILPRGFQYPEITSVRITLDGDEYETDNYRPAEQKMSADISMQDSKIGSVEIGYTETPPTTGNGLFSKEERLLLDAVAERLGVITEHRQAEQALKESEEKFSKAFNASPNLVAINRIEDGKYLEVNDCFTRMTGYTRKEAIGHNANDLNIWVDKDDHLKLINDIKENKKIRSREIRIRNKSGEILTGLFSAEPITIGGEVCTLNTVTDITEQKQSQEILHTVSHGSPLGIYIMQDDCLQYTNPQFQKITGYNQNELIGRELLSLIDVEDVDVVRSHTVFTLQGKSPYPCEYRILNKTGRIKWVMQTASPIHYEGREAVLGNLMDITERKYLERKITEYEELNKMKSNLLATVSHELRTPLATIKGYSTMILDYYSRLAHHEIQDYLASIDNSTDRLTKLVDNLLDSSRMEAGLLRLERTTVDINQLIERVAAEANIREKKHQIVTELNAGLTNVNIDAKRIRQVLDNLLDNAIKYSPQGTSVLISAKKTGRELLISIHDQGAGIPTEELTSIFERMYRIEQRLTSGSDGIGLGLHICQGLVEAHGGRIWADSTMGRGSTFQFTLPLISAGKERIKI